MAIIGHFPHIEELIAPLCRLSILERDPVPGEITKIGRASCRERV